MIEFFSLLIALNAAPTLTADQAIGFYSKGSLTGAVALPNEGPGLLKLFRPRNRAWGTDELQALIMRTADQMAVAFPGLERLQIGDLAARAGGKISSHASHQNGLDVDIGYFRMDAREQDPDKTTGFDEEFVSAGGLTANFDTRRNWSLFETLVASGRVGRIFVDPVIKREMCLYVGRTSGHEAQTETLRRLRPYTQHGDHLHVRIKCPQGNGRCVPQEEPPAGHGCDSSGQIDEGELTGGKGR